MKWVTQAYKHSMENIIRNRSHAFISIQSADNAYPIIQFAPETIVRFKQTDDVDPLSRYLPIEKIEFVIADFEERYDPHNSNNDANLMKPGDPIIVSLGYQMGSTFESIEWLADDNYLLDEQPTHENNTATFRASRRLAHLTETYYKGVFNTNLPYISLKDKAEAVLADAGVHPVFYEIHSSLDNIKSNAPLPIASHKECLQLIAHAAGGTLYTQPDGRITIMPFSIPTQGNGFVLPRRSISNSNEKTTSLPAVSQISVKGYSYNQLSSQPVYRFDLGAEPSETFHVEYDLLYDATITDWAGLPNGMQSILSSELYGRAGDIVFEGSFPNAEIQITGDGVSVNTTVKRVVLSPEGEPDIEDNPLVINPAPLLGLYSDYLPYRLTHTVDYRGNPELQCGDCIMYETRYDTLALALILSSTIYFDGGLNGTLILKNLSLSVSTNLYDKNGLPVEDIDGNQIRLTDIGDYTSEYTVSEINDFIAEV